jgi:hypothetical protein
MNPMFSPTPFFDTSAEDLFKRYRDSCVMYDNEPVCIGSIVTGKDGEGYYMLYTSLDPILQKEGMLDWRKFDLARPMSGYFTFGQNTLLLGWSLPNRQWRRGLCHNNYVIQTMKHGDDGEAMYPGTVAAVLRNKDVRVLSKTKLELMEDLETRGFSIVRYGWAAIGRPNNFIVYYGQKPVNKAVDNVISRTAQKLFSL